MPTVAWELRPGDLIKRTELHARYGGSRQSGISGSATTPNILLFSDPASGEKHGYLDRWEGARFLYVGEGQRGDQEFTKGNKAVLEHREKGRTLRVFKGAGDEVQYLGEYVLDTPAYIIDRAPQTGGGPNGTSFASVPAAASPGRQCSAGTSRAAAVQTRQ